MSDFGQQTFARIKAQYEAMEDFGAGVLYAAISEMLLDNRPDIALALAVDAAAIHSSEDFIVEGETTNNEVFLEVFRRNFFQPIETVPEADRPLWRSTVSHMGTWLTTFGFRIAQGLGVGAEEVPPCH